MVYGPSHWEAAADSAASIAEFEEAPGVAASMSFLDAETMSITVLDIQQKLMNHDGECWVRSMRNGIRRRQFNGG